jgi:hypothetical protein
MTERDGDIAAFLDEFSPRRHEEQGDWDRVAADARSDRRPRRFLAPTRRRRAVLTLAIIGALTVLAVVPAFAVSEGWWFLGFDAPNPTGTIVAVINPQSADYWALVAYLTDHNGRSELCYSLTQSNESGSRVGGCGSGALGEPNLPDPGATIVTTSGVAFGPTTLDVATVEAELGDGSTVQAKIVTFPKALGAPLRFYIAEFPADAALTQIVGKNSEGQVIGTITVPDGTEMHQGS